MQKFFLLFSGRFGPKILNVFFGPGRAGPKPGRAGVGQGRDISARVQL